MEEVFNFFGQPCNFSDLQKTDIILSQHDWGPQPIWQETDNGYIYSAFLTGKIEIRAIALQADAKTIPRNCYLWFEDKKKAIQGKFKFSKIGNDENTVLTSYFYICLLPNIEKRAVRCIFQLQDHKLNVNTTICVSPSVFSKKRFIEFIGFHKLIGIESFIFYDKEIPYRLSKLIVNLSKKLAIQVNFLPWNYPKGDTSLIRSIVENDCMLRTFGQTKYVITLEVNEYIVPGNGMGFDSLVKDFGENFHRLSLPVQKFCIKNLNLKQPIALQNFEVASDFNYNVVRFIRRNTKSDNIISTNAVDKAQASIHKYVRCNLDPERKIIDKTMVQYATDFTSKLT
ncbi:hypothetical protein NQ318_014908 [Aromia moschata]|uniref:Glycosyltransferase family 92 protein n=1 Tax=Aromia moschata TaxID=1265417 RepID=A0AAV8YV36_9CUCU|nr:hypothetical protein NQ318_014908 [Aromia moschata]